MAGARDRSQAVNRMKTDEPGSVCRSRSSPAQACLEPTPAKDGFRGSPTGRRYQSTCEPAPDHRLKHILRCCPHIGQTFPQGTSGREANTFHCQWSEYPIDNTIFSVRGTIVYW